MWKMVIIGHRCLLTDTTARFGKRFLVKYPHSSSPMRHTISEVNEMDHRYAKPPVPKSKPLKEEIPPSKIYPVIDNDLARDNMENDLPAADLEDL